MSLEKVVLLDFSVAFLMDLLADGRRLFLWRGMRRLGGAVGKRYHPAFPRSWRKILKINIVSAATRIARGFVGGMTVTHHLRGKA